MAYRIIEDFATYGSSVQTVLINGSLHPAPVLVEDIDGCILLVVPREPSVVVNVGAWTAASIRGAYGIVAIDEHGSIGMTSEDWSANRGEVFGLPVYKIDSIHSKWYRSTSTEMTYREIVSPSEHQIFVPAPGKFVHLHAHSEFSALDGMSKLDEMVDAVHADGQTALALTDHGTCAGHATLQFTAERHGIKPIFGNETYFVDDRRFRPSPAPSRESMSHDEWIVAKAVHDEEMKRGRDYWHLVLWAFNEEGLRNLWAITTESCKPESRYYKPRIDWEILERYSAGVGASTACLRGPISGALLQGNHELAAMRASRLRAIFDDRLYVEIHTNQLPDQVALNQHLVSMANDFGLPVIAVCDSHYAFAEHKECHRVWMAIQTDSDLADDPTLFAGDQDYHLKTAAEVAESLSYLPESVVAEAMHNTTVVADRCTAVIPRESRAPVFSREATRELSIERDRDRLVEMCLAAWDKKVVGKPNSQDEYAARLEKELRLIIPKSFAGYFLQVEDYCGQARRDGHLIGPGRGSGGGCLVAYLLGITNIDPVRRKILFERFLTKGRVSLPDFDIDFPSTKRDSIMGSLQSRYGQENVVRIGTHIRVKNKGIFKDLGRILQGGDAVPFHVLKHISELVDAYEGDSAGLGKSWHDVMEEDSFYHDDMVAKGRIPAEVITLANVDTCFVSLTHLETVYPRIFELASVLVGRLRAYGKHAAGVIISESKIELPMDEDDGVPVSMLPMDIIEYLGFVKFDLLTLRTLDTLQETVDQIAKRHGTTIDFYDWEDEYDDEATWDLICSGLTLGMFQAETPSMTRLIKKFQPRSIEELADVITLVRPGPERSGLTAEYLARRAGEREVSFVHPILEEILAPTQGVIIYQEQVMQACMLLAGYDEDEADGVRKILGKKQVDKVHAAGVKFVDSCEKVGYLDRQDAEFLWAQLAEFAKYSFGFAHAIAYAMLCHWTAYLKAHYPAEFLAGVLDFVKSDRIPAFVSEARTRDFKVLPPDVNTSGMGFTIVASDELRYGFGALMGIGKVAGAAIVANQPYTDFADFRARSGVNSGVVKKLAAVGAFDSFEPNRNALEARLAYEGSEFADVCVHKNASALGPGGLPCTFDWASVPVELTKSGEPKKNQKGAPKRCTRGCWKYDPTPPPDFASMPMYTPKQIRDREVEMLGLYLSSSPFDDIPDDAIELCATAEQVSAIQPGQELCLLVIVDRVRSHIDRGNNTMAFLSMTTHDGADVQLACFASAWASLSGLVRKGGMGLAIIKGGQRGNTLVRYEPIRQEA